MPRPNVYICHNAPLKWTVLVCKRLARADSLREEARGSTFPRSHSILPSEEPFTAFPAPESTQPHRKGDVRKNATIAISNHRYLTLHTDPDFSTMASKRTPSQIAMRRIQSELTDWLLDDRRPEGCRLESFEPLLNWVILIDGPQTPPYLYRGQTYRLAVNFSDRYPLDPPEVVFLPPSPVHPHIYSNGHICLDILYDGRNGGWSPALTINKVCLSLMSMLASNEELKRPPGDMEYCHRSHGRSPKETRWEFEDDKV